jgi:peptidoglycan/xylan/chitin deacetylase (PgdA/CDA1 family)
MPGGMIDFGIGDGELWLPGLRAVARARAAILGFHGVAVCRRADDLSRLIVNPRRFELVLRLMRDAGFRFVTVADLVAQIPDGRPPAPGLAAVSFDDGLLNNLTTALPIMNRMGIPASVYVTAGLIGRQSPWVTGPAGEMLGADGVRGLAAAGWEIGAHTLTHPDLGRLGYDDCRREMELGREQLEAIVGAPVRTFAYPFGRYGPAALAAARDSGFSAALTTTAGNWSRFELGRAMVSAGDPLAVLMLKLTDRYEPLLASPPLRAARRVSRRLRHRLRTRGRTPPHHFDGAS